MPWSWLLRRECFHLFDIGNVSPFYPGLLALDIGGNLWFGRHGPGPGAFGSGFPSLDGSSFGPGRPRTRVRLSLNGGVPVRRRVSAASFVGPLAQRTSASVRAVIPITWILTPATTSALACRLQLWHRNSAWLLRFFRSLYPQRGQVWDVPFGGTFVNHVPFFSECLSSFCCIAPGLAYARLRLRPVFAFTLLPGFSVVPRAERRMFVCPRPSTTMKECFSGEFPCGVMLEVVLDVGEFPLFTADQFLKLGPTASSPLQAFLPFLQLGYPAQGPFQFRLRLVDVSAV